MLSRDDYDCLLNELSEVIATIAEWRGLFEGDRGYQDLLERKDELDERLKRLREQDEANTP